MIILDTNVVSEPLRPTPDPRVVAWLDAQALETLYLTTISLAEVRFGIAVLPEGRRKRQLRDRFEDEFVPLFYQRVLSFEDLASAAYAEIRARARAQGLALADFDALIAGIAKTHDFAVATRDTSPFAAAEVRAIDPFTETEPVSERDRTTPEGLA